MLIHMPATSFTRLLFLFFFYVFFCLISNFYENLLMDNLYKLNVEMGKNTHFDLVKLKIIPTKITS